jgi:hypothetical protein
MLCVSGMGTPLGLDSPCGDGDGDKSVPTNRDGGGEQGILREAESKNVLHIHGGDGPVAMLTCEPSHIGRL